MTFTILSLIVAAALFLGAFALAIWKRKLPSNIRGELTDALIAFSFAAAMLPFLWPMAFLGAILGCMFLYNACTALYSSHKPALER